MTCIVQKTVFNTLACEFKILCSRMRLHSLKQTFCLLAFACLPFACLLMLLQFPHQLLEKAPAMLRERMTDAVMSSGQRGQEFPTLLITSSQTPDSVTQESAGRPARDRMDTEAGGQKILDLQLRDLSTGRFQLVKQENNSTAIGGDKHISKPGAPSIAATEDSYGEQRGTIYTLLPRDFPPELTATGRQDKNKTDLGNGPAMSLKPLCHCLDSGRCLAHHHVAFVKVHKAASSTVANILQRYGYSRGLRFALPDKPPGSGGYNYLSKPAQPLSLHSVLPAPTGEHYDILWNHAIYNRSAFQAVMPPDTAHISIVREPFQQFVSAVLYYRQLEPSPRQTSGNPVTDVLYSGPPSSLMSYYRNKQAQDLGMNEQHVLNPSLRRQYIQKLASDFHLVMITEFFDESLVLLRRLLCWEIKDIIYIPMNTNARRTSLQFTKADFIRHRQLAPADYDLYNFFRKRFLSIMKSQPPDFYLELQHFKNISLQVKSFCLGRGASMSSTPLNVSSQFNEGFSVTRADCHFLTMPELDFLDILWRRAVSLLPWKEQLKRLAISPRRHAPPKSFDPPSRLVSMKRFKRKHPIDQLL